MFESDTSLIILFVQNSSARRLALH